MVNVAENRTVPPKERAPDDGGPAALLVIDVQERLAPAIAAAPDVVPRIAALIEKAKEASAPILVSEQYSRGLGPTLPALRRLLPADAIVEKIHFAAPREDAFAAALEARGIGRCVVVGMEAHVCVLQTVLALLARGIAVTLVSDAIASRVPFNREAALARAERAGARLCDSAVLLVDWAQPAA